MWPRETRSNLSGRTTGSPRCRRSSTKSEGKNRADSLRDRDHVVRSPGSAGCKPGLEVKAFITVLMIEHASWRSGEGGPTVGNGTAKLDVSRVGALSGPGIRVVR